MQIGISTTQSLERARHLIGEIADNVESVIIGKRPQIELALIALLSQGHLLIEDSPGVGKTMFARSLARSLGCSFKRIQFTADLLPSDVTGASVYNQKTDDFEFRPGPVMAQMVLADEINRATPKVQSALLECMAEGQVSIDGTTYFVPEPFHVIATQNPMEYEGTFPLPENQLDRFLMRLTLGYPSKDNEIAILNSQQYDHPIGRITQVVPAEDLLWLQSIVKSVYVGELIKQYIVAVVSATRNNPEVATGVSPRGSLGLFRTAQARAVLEGRDYVIPDDIKALAGHVLAHRLVMRIGAHAEIKSGQAIIARVLDSVSVPGAGLSFIKKRAS